MATMLASVFLAPWLHMPRMLAAIPPFGYVLVLLLVREGLGLAPPAVAPLTFLPLLWLSVHGSRGQLIVGFLLVAAAAMSGVHSQRSVEQMRFHILVALTTPVVCFTLQQLVQRVRKQAMMLQELATTDVLTGLPNRRAWEERLPAELDRARRDLRPVSVAILDLDHFKRLNDARGHLAGDMLLRAAATTWRGLLRSVDLVARHGGEEFAVLLPSCGEAHAAIVIERLRRATPDGQTCSAGVATWDGIESAEALVARADAAMYEAKRRGRDRTVASPMPRSAKPEHQHAPLIALEA
jgi:diguanylate cyclase (GGDEF)-like protein